MPPTTMSAYFRSSAVLSGKLGVGLAPAVLSFFVFFISSACAQIGPAILTQPQSQTLIVGSDVTFWVTVTDQSAPPLPSVSSGTLQLWLKADVGVVTNSSGIVSQWQDQSGHANHASQSKSNNKPWLVYPPNLGGKAAVRFNGVQD